MGIGSSGGKAPRDAYGEALVELGREREDFMVVDAGVSDSTRTRLFGQVFPERFVNVGIAEGNMVDVAAGLALAGWRVFASSFAIFLAGRAWESIRQSVAYPRLPVTLVGTHAGLNVGEEGASAQMLEDLALMRALPNMTVLSPADAVETRLAVRTAAMHPGPVYIRLPRSSAPVLYDEGHRLEPGWASLLRPGRDAAIFATGVMVGPALEAATALSGEGIEAAVVGVCSIKPFDCDLLAELARSCGAAVTVEDHSVIGGLGGAVAEILSEVCPAPLERVGVADSFGQTGPAEALFEHYGLTAEDIAKAVRRAVARKEARRPPADGSRAAPAAARAGRW